MLTVEFYVKHHFYLFNAQSVISFSNEIRDKMQRKHSQRNSQQEYLGTLDSSWLKDILYQEPVSTYSSSDLKVETRVSLILVEHLQFLTCGLAHAIQLVPNIARTRVRALVHLR